MVKIYWSVKLRFWQIFCLNSNEVLKRKDSVTSIGVRLANWFEKYKCFYVLTLGCSVISQNSVFDCKNQLLIKFETILDKFKTRVGI